MFIRSSKCTIKFANQGKRDQLDAFIDEYRRVCLFYINYFWEQEKVPKFAGKEITHFATTWLSIRAVQCAAQQASGIVRGTRKKHEQRLYRVGELEKEGKDSAKLKALTERQKPSKPSAGTICPELDARFVTTDWDNETSFDGWLILGSIGQRQKIKIPIKKHRQFNKWLSRGRPKNCVRLSKKGITFMFECEETSSLGKEVIGIDVGIKTVISTSQGQQYGDLTEVNKLLSRKKKGSRNFRQAQQLRNHLIGKAFNDFDLTNISIVRCENLKNVRKGKKSSRFLSHWNYKEIFDLLKRKCEETGVHIEALPYSYTSQRCSKCGWTQKKNRQGLKFKCKHCGFVANADLNAALNISLNLPPLDRNNVAQKNMEGFFWGEAYIVPHVQENYLPGFIREE